MTEKKIKQLKRFQKFLIEDQRRLFQRFADLISSVPQFKKEGENIRKFGEEHYNKNKDLLKWTGL